MADHVIERFPVPLPGTECDWFALLIRTHRLQGRRLQVRTPRGVVMFDSGDCATKEAVIAKLDPWLTEMAMAGRVKPVIHWPSEDTAEFEAVSVLIAN